MAWVVYNNFKNKLFTQEDAIDWDDNSTTTIKVGLVTSAYTPNIDSDAFWGTPDGSEVSGSGYSAGGVAVTGRTTNIVSASDLVQLIACSTSIDGSAAMPTWSQDASGFSNAHIAVLYKSSGSPATSPLIAYASLGGSKGNVDGDLTLSFASNIILTLA